MTCLDESDGSVGSDELKSDVCPVFWISSEVGETGIGVWLTRMVVVEETVGSVAADWELVPRCAQEVGSVLLP